MRGRGGDDVETFGEVEELDGDGLDEFGPRGRRQQPRVAVADAAHELHQADGELRVGEPGHVVVESLPFGLELVARHFAERVVVLPLQLAREEREVVAQALFARHPARVNDA